MIPEGMRDVLPPETRRLRAIEDLLRARFVLFGYGEVRTPWLEFAETLEAPDDDTLSAGYRLHDEQGHELMVRTDMTVPVARMAADRCDDEPLPLRFCYFSPSIRPWAPQRGQDGEFQQAGVELLGLDSAEADAECVTLLCDVLAGLGLRDYTVTLGSAAYQEALIDSLGLPVDDRGTFIEALADRDFPLVESVAGNAAVDEGALKTLWRVLELSGGEEILGQARKLACNDVMQRAVARLGRVSDLVSEAGFGERLAFDLGLIQDLTYYTGLIVEAYAPGRGAAACHRRPLRRPARPLRLGHPRRGVRRGRGPRRRRLGRGRRGARRSAGRDPLRRRPRGACAGGGAAPRRRRRRRTAGGRRGCARRRCCGAGAAPTRSFCRTGAMVSGDAREIAAALGL